MITKTDLFKGLLATALALSANHISAYTNKTYLPGRPINHDIAAKSVAFADHAHHANKDFGGSLQVNAFYSRSHDKQGIGRYFGINDRATFDATVPYASTNWGNAHAITFAPTEYTYGLRFNYRHELKRLSPKLFLALELPLATVVRSMNMLVDGDNSSDVFAFFNGSQTPIAANTAGARTPLTNAKIDGINSCSKITNLDVRLGYVFIDNRTTRLEVTALLGLPLGNKPEGIYAFEAVAGNGGHYELGASSTLMTNVWNHGRRSIDMTMGIDYRYGFEAIEKRTVGIKGVNFGQYNSVGITANSAKPSTQQLFPAANILTVDTRVSPRSSFETLVGLTYNHEKFTLTLGHNLAYQGKGGIEILDKGWDDSKYGYITQAVSMNDTLNTFASRSGVTPLTKAALDASTTQVRMMTHTVFTELSRTFNHYNSPIFVAVGGSYELAGSNSSVERFSLNCKTGFTF